MRSCPACSSLATDAASVCPNCGKPFPVGEGTVTSQLTHGMLMAHAAQLRRHFTLAELFAKKPKVVVGRTADCDLTLAHPTVSRFHALLEQKPDGVYLSDLGSSNGVTIAGVRLQPETVHRLRPGESIGIGPFLLSLDDAGLRLTDNSQQFRIEARRLEKTVTDPAGRRRKLLDDINVVVEPGEFVCLLGPSGSGKSTLMDCLNGRRRATGGRVLANGEDFYRHFDSFRQSIGYVPQKDIVHAQLTVERALYYTAKLRLPPDTTPTELERRVEDVLRQMELTPHRSALVANLSGGQVKRVSLGAELLARPSLLFVDEATSGLDARTEARMMQLFRQLADEGKSLLCITHHLDNVERCHLIVVLSQGRLVYYGPPQEAKAYFGVPKLADVYDKIGEKPADDWAKQFADSPLHAEYVAGRQNPTPDDPPSLHGESTIDQLLRMPAKRPRWLQFRMLTARYTELLWNDRRSLRLLLLQAPIVGLVLLLGFLGKPYDETIFAPRRLQDDERQALTEMVQVLGETKQPPNPFTPKGQALIRLKKEYPNAAKALEKMRDSGLLEKLHDTNQPVVPESVIVNPRHTYVLLFITAMTVIWLGCNNASKEIVKEEAIYARERAVNLGITPYLASKFVVLSVFSAVQVGLLLLTVFGTLELMHLVAGQPTPPLAYRLDYASLYGIMVLLAVVGVALGLALSAAVSTPDRANALLPYVLIPQIILGGGIIPVRHGLLHLVAVVGSPVYWAYRAAHRGETELPVDLPFHETYDDRLIWPVLALLAQTAVLLIVATILMRRKDVRSG